MKRTYRPVSAAEEMIRDLNMLEDGVARLCDRLADGSDLSADERVGLARTILALELQRQEKSEAYRKTAAERF